MTMNKPSKPNHFLPIYQSQAAAYHQMIRAEDPDGNLPAALARLAAPLSDRRVLDLGTGTGRIPLLIASKAASFTGLDFHRDMLRENQAQRAWVGGGWALVQGNMLTLPFAKHGFDLVTAGWAIGHFTGWFAPDWQPPVHQVLAEMHRMIAPGGVLVIMEIMGLAVAAPAPPVPELAEYYTLLEQEWGFRREVIPFDMVFDSPHQAADRTAFFFGETLADQIRQKNQARITEWAGIWFKHI